MERVSKFGLGERFVVPVKEGDHNANSYLIRAVNDSMLAHLAVCSSGQHPVSVSVSVLVVPSVLLAVRPSPSSA